MEIEKMIDEMDKAVNGTLTITHYLKWELHSYGRESLFSYPRGAIKDKSFMKLIWKGYEKLEAYRLEKEEE